MTEPPRLPVATAITPAVSPPQVERWIAGFVVLVSGIAFTIGSWLEPYDVTGAPRMHGTHRQLGLPPCILLATTGFPCPSCGMTTSISLVCHGDLVAACRVNWAGPVVAGVGMVATTWLALLAAGRARRPRFSAENVIVVLTVIGTGAVLIRYLGVVIATLATR